jgi:hypothetical protein
MFRLGGSDDEDVLKIVWYRMFPTGSLEVIEGVIGGFYQPSVDDIGARLLCRCQDSIREEFTGFGEVGPILLGASACCFHICATQGSTWLTLRSG